MSSDKNPPLLGLGLVHWPCWNQNGEVIATNVTNFDIHDIARSCRSFGITKYYIINKVREQLMFVHRVLDHWRVGEGSEHNPQRRHAVEMVDTAETLELALARFSEKPLVVATSAQTRAEYPQISFGQLKERIWCDPSRPVFLVFGTGWGLTDDVLKMCDYVLPPIRGSSIDDYRHLSVRAAVAIVLDRLLGQP